MAEDTLARLDAEQPRQSTPAAFNAVESAGCASAAASRRRIRERRGLAARHPSQAGVRPAALAFR